MRSSASSHDPLFVGAADDQRAVAVFEHLFDGDDLAHRVEAPRHDDVERLVEHDLLAAFEARVEVGMDRDPHLAAAGEHVDGLVVVDRQHGAVGVGRLGQLVDLFAEGGDVLARLTQGVGQLLVLRNGLRELAFGLEQAFFERANTLRGLLQALA